MSFTRFKYDDARVEKQLQQSTDPGRYVLNVPGPADSTKYIESPMIRLQKFGNQIRTNSTNIESDLRGLTRNLNRDNMCMNNYKKKSVSSSHVNYDTEKSIWTDQSRVTHPAWHYRDSEQYRPNHLFYDPQENVCMPFYNNLNTRILEKDYYEPKTFTSNFRN